MPISLRSSLSLTLLLTLAGACGEDATTPMFGPIYPGVDSGTGLGDPATPATPDAGLPNNNNNENDGESGDGFQGGEQDAGAQQNESDAGSEPSNGGGDCCPDGNCLCHGPAPTALTADEGPFATDELTLPLGTVTYPTDAEAPFAAVALCGGFTNSGPEMAAWAPFYASHGIVTIITNTGPLDDPGTRGNKLLAALDQLAEQNDDSASPLFGKLDLTRLGTSGYSMGGGGTTLASVDRPSLKTSVGLAAWAPTNSGITVPTLLLCGKNDGTAPCSMSEGAYEGIDGSTPKMMVAIDGATHFAWFGPDGAGGGISGKYALAFQKVYLEGDTRWLDLLTSMVSGSTQTTNIQ